ncbi:MAG: DNA primase, partial [Novosphingobium sp.]|nr:DNA primase [Novosphingobium sp.]
WMTDQRGLSFMDAVKELAAEAGMDVPAPDPRAAKQAEQRNFLYDVTEAAQSWFAANLAAPAGQGARDYLTSRGFDQHTITRFGFGLAPDSRNALKQALGQFDEKQLIEAGLRISVEDREPYDRFRGRLMLPIEDARGRVIAFGGRILDASKTDAPKYLNSPDTPLFDKGRTLYNLHRAGPLARQSGRMVVVEGYMDVIALSAAGIGECVAPLGTALTERQLEMLWRIVEVPILCFDGDAAGQRAAMRAIVRALPLLRPSHSLRIVRLPSGLDPDDLVKQQGVDAMTRLLDDAASLLDTLWTHERDAAPLSTPEDKAGLKARLLGHVETIGDPDIRSLYRRDLLDRFSAFAYPQRQSSWRANRAVPQPQAPPSAENAGRLRRMSGGGARDSLAAAVLAGLIRWPGEIARHADTLACSPNLDPRFAILLDLHESGETLESSRIGAILADKGLAKPLPEDYARIRYPFVSDTTEERMAVEALAAAIAKLFEEPVLDRAIEQATTKFDIEEQQRLLKRKKDINERMRRLASETQDL